MFAITAVLQSLALDPGEDEALRLLTWYTDAILLTDDRLARSACEQLGRSVRGTIGVILEAERQGVKTKQQILTLLRAIPARSTLHVHRRFLQEIIAQVQEEFL